MLIEIACQLAVFQKQTSKLIIWDKEHVAAFIVNILLPRLAYLIHGMPRYYIYNKNTEEKLL